MPPLSRIGLATLTSIFVCAGLAAAQEEPLSLRLGLGGTPPEKVMPAVDTVALAAEDAATKPVPPRPLRFAVAHDVRITLADGRWDLVGDAWIWRIKITSRGAKSINLGFTRYEMPQGGQLYIYRAGYAGGAPRTVRRFGAEDNESHGQLWTPIVEAPSVVVEAVVPAAERARLQLELTKVNHGYRSIRLDDEVTIQSGSCNVDVVCPEGDLYRNEIRAVAAMHLNGTGLCTGSAINNTGAKRPYFITADHCGVRASNAASLVVYWNFQNSWCRPVGSSASGGNGDGTLSQFNSGSFFRATWSTSDVTLVELDDAPQAAFNVYLAGWDRRAGPFSDGAVAIHHPSVDEKRISLSHQTTQDDAGTHHRVWWRPSGIGVTEPGSSGSPLYSKQGRFIGQLTGGGSACGAPSSDMWDVYGKLSRSWDGGGSAATRVRDYLDPLGTAPLMIDGRNWNDGVGTPTPTPTLTPTQAPRPTITPTPTSTPLPGGHVEITPAASAVTASTHDGNAPANVVDNNLATRWSANGDGAWVRFDLGTSRAISRVAIAAYRGNERRNRFDLQVSNDGATWTNVLTAALTSGTTTSEETFDVAATARYIRYVGHGATLNAGGASSWTSVTELSLFTPTSPTHTPTPTPTATPVPTARPTAAPTAGPAYVEVTPPASSVTASANDGNLPGNTVDNNLATRWSANGDGAWIQYDLGVVRTVGHVGVAVYNGNGRRNRFDVVVSMDAATWTPVLTGALTSGTTTLEQSHDIPDTPARFVRYVGHGASLNAGGTSTWNSVTEISVFAQATAGTPTSTPTATPVTSTPTPTATPTPGGSPTPTPTPPSTEVVLRPGDVLNDQIFEWRAGFATRSDGTYGEYRVDMAAGTSYTFTTAASVGGGNDTFLYLLNAAMQVVAFDDDAGEGNHSLLTFQPPAAGTYYLRLRAYTQGASGTCRLSVGGGQAGNPLLPDLVTLANSGSLRDAFIVTESGRKRLRFSNGVANRGAGALEVYGVVHRNDPRVPERLQRQRHQDHVPRRHVQLRGTRRPQPLAFRQLRAV